ncbi:MAG TPA: hypothetical protein VFT69_12855 [Pseudolabrys sp.]|nr:hypothetical protein [Pseudolabrys sp.]
MADRAIVGAMSSEETQSGTDAAVVGFIRSAGLAPHDAPLTMRRLTGGVSSDIWLMEAGDKSVCVKRALPKLRVAM